MTKERRMEDAEMLDRLQDALIDDILSMTPEELVAETTADDVEEVKSSLAAAVGKVGRAKLERAKSAAKADARRPRPVGLRGGDAALREARANDPKFDQKMTLAARKGGPDYEADRVGIEDDLEELRRWSEEGNSV